MNSTRFAKTTSRTTKAMGLGIVAAMLMGGGVALADTNDVVHAGCVQTTSGTLRVLNDPTARCAADERRIDWNQAGPQGPTGATGLPGPRGDTGATGPAGTPGVDAKSKVRVIDHGMFLQVEQGKTSEQSDRRYLSRGTYRLTVQIKKYAEGQTPRRGGFNLSFTKSNDWQLPPASVTCTIPAGTPPATDPSPTDVGAPAFPSLEASWVGYATGELAYDANHLQDGRIQYIPRGNVRKQGEGLQTIVGIFDQRTSGPAELLRCKMKSFITPGTVSGMNYGRQKTPVTDLPAGLDYRIVIERIDEVRFGEEKEVHLQTLDTVPPTPNECIRIEECSGVTVPLQR
ncbi:MAG: collagen-like protein [Microthrixaceae bacterium]